LVVLALLWPAPVQAEPVTAPGGAPFFPAGVALPRHETEWERSYTATFEPAASRARAARFGTAAPSGPLVCTAEFGPVEGIVMAWEPSYLSTGTAFQVALAQVITSEAGNAKLYLQVDNDTAANSARTVLEGGGIDVTNKVVFVVGANDSIWMRDYGPRYVYEGDTRAIVDHVYNRPRPNDNVFPATFAAFKRHSRYEMNMEHGGGNYHLDTNARGFATRLIVNENPGLTESQIVANWRNYQGLETTLTAPFPTSVDSTQHIDMWMIPVGPKKVIVSDWPTQSGSTQDQICDATAAALEADGYAVFRVPARSVGGTHYTYCNAMICNDAVAIPSYTNSTIVGAGYNAQALAAWQAALPGHTVTAVPSQAIVTLSGVMHCIVMHVPPNRNGARPGVYVKSQNTAQAFTAGQQVPIEWASDDDKLVTAIDIALSTDGGATFAHTVATGTADDGAFSWTVPEIGTAAGRVRVTARDADGNSGDDVNDADFVIVTQPAGWVVR